MRRAHKDVGMCMERVYKERIDEVIFDIVYHFNIALDFEKIIEWGIKAGERCIKIYAPNEAVAHYKLALNAIDTRHNIKVKKERIAHILSKLGELSWITGEWDAGIKYNERLISLSTKEGDTKSVAEAQYRLAMIFIGRSRYDEAIEALEKSLRTFTDEGDIVRAADCHRGIGKVFRKKGQLDEALESYSIGVGLAERAADENLLGRLYNDMGVLYVFKENYDLAEEHFKMSIDILEKTSDQFELCRAYNNIGSFYLKTKEYETALGYFKEQIIPTKKIGDKNNEGFSYVNAAEAMTNLGGKENLVQAEEYCKKGLQIFEMLGEKHMIAASYASFAIIYHKLQDWNRAIKHFEKSIEIMKDADLPYYIAELQLEFGLMYGDKGDEYKAINQISKAQVIWQELGNKERVEEAKTVLMDLRMAMNKS